MDKTIEINNKRKKLEGILTIAIICFIIFITIIYLTLLKDLFRDSFISVVVSHIKKNITEFNLLGSLYTALFGGLFFIFFPMEAYFFNALRYNNYFVLAVVFLSGLVVSYSIDYLIGMKMSKIAKRVVSTKKFYRIKSYINRYGKIAIFLASAIPLFPSQQVTFISGVFRYNKLRLFMITMAGQMIKYAVLIFVFTLL